MIKFKLPKLHLLLNSNKEVLENDYSRLIHVKDGLAFVLNGSLFCCVDLREWIKAKSKIADSEEVEEMDSILGWFEGKSYTKAFWSELVGEQDVSLNVEDLQVTKDHYSKSLDYDPVEPGVLKHLLIIQQADRKAVKVDDYHVNGSDIVLLNKAFGSELAADKFAIRSTGIENCLHFAFVRQNYIFGFMLANYDGASEMFDHFEGLSDLVGVLRSAS